VPDTTPPARPAAASGGGLSGLFGAFGPSGFAPSGCFCPPIGPSGAFGASGFGAPGVGMVTAVAGATSVLSRSATRAISTFFASSSSDYFVACSPTGVFSPIAWAALR